MEEKGIGIHEWDECFAGTMATQIEKEYDSYFYDGLPAFAQRFLDT